MVVNNSSFDITLTLAGGAEFLVEGAASMELEATGAVMLLVQNQRDIEEGLRTNFILAGTTFDRTITGFAYDMARSSLDLRRRADADLSVALPPNPY